VSAALALVPARLDDDRPVATWADDDGAQLAYMTRDRVDALVAQTRTALAVAGANLVELRRGNAHLVAGFDSWHEAVEHWFGDLTVYRLVQDRQQQLAEREALIASLTLAGHTVREQRDALGTSIGTVHATQRRLGLIPDRPLPAVVADPEPIDPFWGLSPRWSALARVAAQGERGLTSLELDAELDAALGTATGSLSKLAARGLVVLGDHEEARDNRRPYRVTDAGRARLVEVLAARDAAEVTAA
jgi:hypothetical protein